MLPFDNIKNRRVYQCFVCGLYFENNTENNINGFESFKSHIIETHREGDEYVCCPLPWCKAPVRDMRLHFSVKHAGQEMPKVGQTKAMIWKDFSARGKIKTRKPKFREGNHDSTKMQRQFHFRSGYEKSVYECLDMMPEVVAYDVEPFKIKYIHKGQEHDYTPDIIVTFSDSHREVWEIKPSSQTLLEINQDKWKEAHLACQARGWTFVVITEKGIDKMKARIRTLFG